MNDTQIGLKNLIAYLELEYWLAVREVTYMSHHPKAEKLRDLLKSIVNNTEMPKSLALNDLINYSQTINNPVLIEYLENTIKVNDEITTENISTHEEYLKAQIFYVHYFNKAPYSLNLKSSTMSITLRTIDENIFGKIFKDKEAVKINEHSQFEATNKYKLFKKILLKKTHIIGGPKECAEYITKFLN